MKQVHSFQKVNGSKQKKEQLAKDYQGAEDIPEEIPEKTIDHQQSQDLFGLRATKDKISLPVDKETISSGEVENSQHRNRQNRELTSCHLKIFKNVYSELGPNWTKILRILNEEHQIFLGSSTNDLKNLFCNSIRRLGKIFEK